LTYSNESGKLFIVIWWPETKIRPPFRSFASHYRCGTGHLRFLQTREESPFEGTYFTVPAL
jgi:hypothetical protein